MCLVKSLDEYEIVVLLGPRSTGGPQGVGFQTSSAQPKDDPRPYLQYIMFGVLVGSDFIPEDFVLTGDKFGFKREVCTLKCVTLP